MYLYYLLCTFAHLAFVSGITANNDAYMTDYNMPLCLDVLTNDVGSGLSVDSTVANNGFPLKNYPPFYYQYSHTLAVVIEAENYQGINFRGGPSYSTVSDPVTWQLTTGYSGSSGSAMIALPATGINIPNSNYGTALKFNVAFQTSKAYRAWIRGESCTSCATNSGVQLLMQDAVQGFYTFVTSGTSVANFSNSWQWVGSGPTVNVNGNEATWPPLIKPVYVAMKTDGFVFDKMILDYGTNDTVLYGSGTGPAQSPLLDCGSGLTYFPKQNWTGVDTFTYTATDGSTFSSASVSVTVIAPSPSPSVTPSRSRSPSATPSVSSTPSVTPSRTPSPSVSPSSTPSRTPSASRSSSPSPSSTPSTTPSISSSPSRSVTPSVSRTPSITPSISPSASPLPYSEASCPLLTPYRCSSDGACVTDPQDCVIVNSNDTVPFLCSNGTFVAYPAECNVESCSCWNGDCQATEDTCPFVPGCPSSLPKRCWNGCVSASESCDPYPSCDVGLLCPDGTCRTSSTQACLAFNGCPLESPIQCPNGNCVSDNSQCLCQNGLYSCFDGSCAQTCERPPSSVKPVGFWVTVDTSEDSQVDLVADDSTPLGSISVPAGSLTPANSGNSVIVGISSVADSELRQMGSTQDVFSAAFRLDSSTVQTINSDITVTLGVNLPQNQQIEDSCLAQYTSSGWTCVSDLTIVSTEPTTVHATLNKETTATYSVVSSPKQKDDSKKEKDIVKYGIIAGSGFAGLVILGGLIAMIALYKSKAMKRDRQMSQMKIAMESGVYKTPQVDLPPAS